MPTPYRAHWLGVLLSVTLATGCVDTAGDFDDFVSRIPDAQAQPDAPILLSIPDISGRFFLALASVVDVDRPILFIVENTVTGDQGGSATIDTSFTPLDLDKQIVTGGTDLSFQNIPISMTGQFTVSKDDVSIPGPANPITGTELIANTVTFIATIKNEDLYCGDATGMVQSPLMVDLAGSTFAAVRVPDGAIGDQLPDPVGDCPDDPNADAGVPDAMPPADAGIPDATVPDALVNDAQVTDAAPSDA